jgi:predicted component of type VI protein secretion system
MLVVLQATSVNSRPQRLQLRAHQVAKVGRSEWADFSFSNDMAMADVQFEIRSTADACVVRSLSTESPTLVNGEEIESVTIHDGDQIEAGQTKFVVRIEGERTTTIAPDTMPPEAAPSPTMPPALVAKPTELSLVATCAYLEFADDVGGMAATAKSPDDLIATLAEQEKFQDALRLRAHLLTKRQAVWWGCLCARELDAPLAAAQTAALRAAANWTAEPDEKHRRVAEQSAETAKFSGIGAMLALSAFWSDGSMAPEGNPDVPPDERLTSQGVSAALISAAYHGDPTKATDRFHAFLAKGKDIADEKVLLPEAEVEW